MQSRIMYVECKSESLNGPARIGRVSFSRTGRTLYYGGRTFQKVTGYKYNHIEAATGEPYWISGCHRDGADRNYASNLPIEIDEDVREEYWTVIRRLPSKKDERSSF